MFWASCGLPGLAIQKFAPGGENDGGVLIVGDRNMLMHGVYGGDPRLIPETKHLAYRQPVPTMSRSPGIYQEWIDAIHQ